MTLTGLAARNVLRNRFRGMLTVLGAALAVASFIIIRTVSDSYSSGAKMGARDRVVARHKVTFIMPLPKRYAAEVAQLPGVKRVSWANWFGARDPKNETDFFGSMAVDTKSFFDVYYDMRVAPDVMERFLADRQGAVVGDALAKAHGWKVGDTVHLSGTIYPGDWEFHISGFYEPLNKSFDRRSVFFQWDYLNDSLTGSRKDQIGWIVAQMQPGQSAAQAGLAIDSHFEDHDVQTLSQDEQAFNRSFLGMFSAVLSALDWSALIIIGVLALIIGNTISMGVRERTHEYGVMRAIGFLPRHVATLVLVEGAVLGALAAAVGVTLGLGCMSGLGRYIVENMGSILPVVTVEPKTVSAAAALALLMAFAASILPARTAWRLRVANALHRIG